MALRPDATPGGGARDVTCRRCGGASRLAAAALICALSACSGDEGAFDPSEGPVVVSYNPTDVDLAQLFERLLADVNASPASGPARGRLGMAYEINDYKEAAIESYRQAAALDPGAFNWTYFRALLVAELGDPQAALEVLDAAIAVDGDYAPAWLWRGSWLRDLGSFDDAIAAFERASELGAETTAEVGIAQTLLRQSKAEEALALLRPLAKKANHPHVFRLLGRAHQALGNADEARIAAARGRNPAPLQWRDPRHAEKWDMLASYGGRLVHAEQLLKAGRFGEVIEVLSPMLEAYPDDEVVLANLAMAVGRDGDIERATELVERGLRMNPDYYRFHNVSASLRFHQGEDAAALAHLEQSVTVNPVQAWPYRQMGTILMRQERYDDALDAFDKALEYGVENPERVLHTAGMIEGARERWPEAIERFERATAIHPAFTMAFVYLGRSLAEARRFDEARAALAWAEQLDTHPSDLRGARVRLAALEKASAADSGAVAAADGG